MKEINWGIIGCGDVTERKSGPAFNNVADSKLVAVMRRDGKKAADYAKRHNVPRWYDDADALINDPEVNAIYVATPPDTHARYAIRAMRAGKPVYVEKPMARNTDECRDMIAVSNQTGQALYVAYYRRAMPYFEKIRELIEINAIGDIRMVNVVLHAAAKKEELGPDAEPGWRVDPLISGGGHFHDLASHQFDYFEYIFGPIKIAGGITANQAGLYDAEDIVAAIFEFESGILGTGSWCFSVAEKQQQEYTEIIGSRGKITFSFFGSTTIKLEKEGSKVEHIEIGLLEHVQLPLISQVVDDLLGRGVCVSTGESAMRTSMILDQITGL